MIQLNLLPDVKLEYIKAQKLRSLVTSISVIVTAVSIAILVLFLLFDFAQKSEISSHKSSITDYTTQLENKPNINTILTVQNQLTSLTGLYAKRPAVNRLFNTYLGQITPEAVSISTLNASFTSNTATFTGTADSLVTINKYVDTLKLTTYSVGSSKTSAPAFTNVVLTGFSVNSQTQNTAQAAGFTITLDFAPTIFDTTQNVTLNIPNSTVTHSQQSDSGSLFQAAPSGTGGK